MKVVYLFILLAMSSWVLADYNPDDDRFSKQLKNAIEMIEVSNYEQAIQILNDLVNLQSEDADVWNLLGYSNRKLGNLEDAEHSYRQALLYNPEHKGALEYQGELFLQQNDLASAKKNLQKLREICPQGCEELTVLEQALASH